MDVNEIYDQLLRYGCIQKDNYLEVKAQLDWVSDLRADFLNGLERKNEGLKRALKEIHEEETQLLDEIKYLIKTGEFKRAYQVSENKEMLDLCLEMLEENMIECTKGLEDLKKIKNFIQETIFQQKQIDEMYLKNIKRQVGTKVWEDFRNHFESDQFLLMYERK